MMRYGGLVVGLVVVACGPEGGLQSRSDASATGGRSGGTGGAGGRSSDGAGGKAAALGQAAVTFKIGVAPGKVCAHTSGQLASPSNVAGVLDALSCDLSAGCKPDEYVVEDRDRGISVTCSVMPNGASFNVSVRLSVDGTPTGDPSITFQLNGVLSPTGGTATVAEQNSVAQGGGTDDACNVVISSPRGGLVKDGAIWASFQCDAFRDRTDISETGCVLSGTFLFENCAS